MKDCLMDSVYFTLYAFALWSIVWNIYQMPKRGVKAIAFGVSEAVVFCVSLFWGDYLQYIMIYEVLFSFVMVKDKILNKTINILIAFFSVGVFEDIFRIIWMVITKERSLSSLMRLIGILLAIAVLFFIRRLEIYKNLLLYSEKIRLRTKFLCLMTMVIMMLMVSFGIVILENDTNNAATSLFLLLALMTLLMACTIIVDLYYEANRRISLVRENEIKETVINNQKNVYRLLVENNKEIRIFRHDLANHLGVLKMMLENKEIEEASLYLNKLISTNEDLFVRQNYFGDNVLDVVISMMCCRAKEKNIKLTVEGQIDVHKINVFDLCDIFLNAIGNAVEACEKQHISGPIRVVAHKSDSLQIISVSNPATKEMYDNIVNGKTSKENKSEHGIGTKSIKRAVYKMGGEMTYEYLNEELRLVISIEL